MSNTTQGTHPNHQHTHGVGCGHTGIQHEGHVDYLHDGHLHHQDSAQTQEHALSVSNANPADCTPDHRCGGHEAAHVHGKGCGHAAVPHGEHIDYLVDGHLHFPHETHCDFHGAVLTVV